MNLILWNSKEKKSIYLGYLGFFFSFLLSIYAKAIANLTLKFHWKGKGHSVPNRRLRKGTHEPKFFLLFNLVFNMWTFIQHFRSQNCSLTKNCNIEAKPSLAYYSMDISRVVTIQLSIQFLALKATRFLVGLVTTCILLATSKIKGLAKIPEEAKHAHIFMPTLLRQR